MYTSLIAWICGKQLGPTHIKHDIVLLKQRGKKIDLSIIKNNMSRFKMFYN